VSYALVRGFIELKRIAKHGLSENRGFESRYVTSFDRYQNGPDIGTVWHVVLDRGLENEGLFARFQTVPATSLAVLVAQGCAKHWISGHPSGRASSFDCFEKMCLPDFILFFFREPGLRLIRGREERSWPRSMSSQSSPESTTLSGSHQASHGGTSAGAIAAVVVIVVALAVGVAAYLGLRWRARRTDYDPERRPRASMSVEGNHAPAPVSPYGSTSNLVPHFRAFSRPSLLFRVL